MKPGDACRWRNAAGTYGGLVRPGVALFSTPSIRTIAGRRGMSDTSIRTGNNRVYNVPVEELIFAAPVEGGAKAVAEPGQPLADVDAYLAAGGAGRTDER